MWYYYPKYVRSQKVRSLVVTTKEGKKVAYENIDRNDHEQTAVIKSNHEIS